MDGQALRLDERLVRLASEHGGVLPYACAVAAGLTPEEWRWLGRHPALTRPRRGVLAPVEDDRAVLAAAQAMTPAAVVSHHSAASLHRLALLRPVDHPPTLTIAKRPNRTPREDVGVRFLVAGLPEEHVTVINGVRVTTLERTCLDIARTTELRDGLVVTDAALRAGASESELVAAVRVMRGWPGVRTAKAVVKLANVLRESPLESFGAAVWSEYGLPPSRPQIWIYDEDGFVGRVDELWEEQQTVGEADGNVKYVSPYGSSNPLVDEKIRQERLERAGLAVVRYGSTDLWRRPRATANRVLEAFGRGRHLTPRFLASPVQLGLRDVKAAWYVRFPPLFDG